MKSAPQPSLPLSPCLPGVSRSLVVVSAVRGRRIPNLQASHLKDFNIFPFNLLPPLCLSLRSFSDSRPLFSTTSALFLQNTRGGIPLRELLRCTEAQKRLFVSPLLATLTQTPGMGVSRLLQSPPRSFCTSVATPILLVLCFHTLTNCFSRKPFILTTIRIARG